MSDKALELADKLFEQITMFSSVLGMRIDKDRTIGRFAALPRPHVQEWISVEQEPPPDTADEIIGYKPTLDWGRRHITTGKSVRHDKYYTHWQPLPPAPVAK